jgi:hypothetical protein
LVALPATEGQAPSEHFARPRSFDIIAEAYEHDLEDPDDNNVIAAD